MSEKVRYKKRLFSVSKDSSWRMLKSKLRMLNETKEFQSGITILLIFPMSPKKFLVVKIF